MNPIDYLALLRSTLRNERFMAAKAFAVGYHPEAEDELIQALIREPDYALFSIMASAVIPIRIIKLDQALLSLNHWPFDAGRTHRIVKLMKGFKMRSIEPHLEDWRASGEPNFLMSWLTCFVHWNPGHENTLSELDNVMSEILGRYGGTDPESRAVLLRLATQLATLEEFVFEASEPFEFVRLDDSNE